MKLLLQAYNTCCQNQFGGVQHRVRRLFDEYQTLGLKVSLFNPYRTIIDNNTILHVFMLNFENYQLVKCAKDKGAKVIISSIVNLQEGNKIDLCRILFNKAPILTTHKMHFAMLSMCDNIVVETNIEKEFIHRHYGVPESKMITIPNGIDEINNPGGIIYDVIGEKCKYILVVGRFDENKNQLSIIRAFRDDDIHIVFIGGADFRGEDYYNKCVEEARSNNKIHFLGWIEKDSSVLASAYCNADTVVVPSFNETFGFTILEGSIAGAKIVLSKSLPILEYSSFKDCKTFDPSSVEDIRKTVKEVYEQPKTPELRNRVTTEFSWKAVAKQHVALYSQIGELQ